jgi:hypothetical protein
MHSYVQSARCAKGTAELCYTQHKAEFRPGSRVAVESEHQHPKFMKTLIFRVIGGTIGGLLACATLAAAGTLANPPKIISPANGATPSSAKPLLVKVDTGDMPNVHTVEILSNGTPVGRAIAPDFLGEWEFASGGHLSVMKPDPFWGPNPPAFIIDYHPNDYDPMMFFQGDFVSPTQFVGDTGGHETTPLAVTIDFTRVDDKINIVITGEGNIGTRTNEGGELRRPGRTTFMYSWAMPPVGVHNLTARLTYTDDSTWEKAEYTTAAVKVTVKAPPAPEIDVRYAGKSLRDNKSSTGYGTVRRGAKSKAATYTILNAGNAALKNLKVAVKGSHAKDFLVTQPGKTSIGAQKETTFKVTFAPRKKGTRKAQLHILSNDSDENPFRVTLQGTGR